MKVKTVTKYGGSAKEGRDGFNIEAEAEISDKQINALAGIGLASILYRAGASAMNTALDVDNNSATEYSDDRAAKLTSALGAWAASDDDSPLDGGFSLETVITRHVHGQGADSKFTKERAKYASKNGDAKALTKLAQTVGYDGEVGDGKADSAPQEFLVAIRNWVKAQADAL